MLICLAVLGTAALPTAKGDGWDKKTILTFSGPVKLADTTLPAGAYVFKLLDSSSDRHIVQIFNQDETHIFATILAMPAYRLEPADSTVVKFSETSSSGATQEGQLPSEGVPIKLWFYPGDNYGQEFRVQPASMTAAAAATQPAGPEPKAESAPNPEAQATPEPSSTTEEASSATEQQSSAAASEPSSSTNEQAAPSGLPKTASNLPLVGLLGLLSLGTAVGLRLYASRRA
jgi:hypothetical protein